jgi:hypothetical protein
VLAADGTYEESEVLTRKRKGTWKEISKTNNTITIELDFTDEKSMPNGAQQREIMSIAVIDRGQIQTNQGADERTWRRQGQK